MAFEIDHLFVCVSRGAPEVERLLALGMTEGSANVHAGQGTANRRIFLANAFLEFLWVHDEREATAEPAAGLKLWERWAGRGLGACPFGVCLRGLEGDAATPFPAWDYRPAYLPGDAAVPFADNAALVHEPLLFSLPWGMRPDQLPSGREEPLGHPAEMREITGVRITVALGPPPSPSLRAMERTGLIELVEGPTPLMEVTFDHQRQGRAEDLRPELPLVLRW